MIKYRFIIDDLNISKTQNAVLSVFVDELKDQNAGEVIRSSELPKLKSWNDVPLESSLRLSLRIEAMKPIADTSTVFLPAHLIPGRINNCNELKCVLGSKDFFSVSELDLFVVNNNNSEFLAYDKFVQDNPSYEDLSCYSDFSCDSLPEWLIEGGLESALLLSDRPWYNANAPACSKWLIYLKKAIDNNYLTLAMIEEDIIKKRIRPSLLRDVEMLLNETKSDCHFHTFLDSLFIYPELCLTEKQKNMLSSNKLQHRILEYRKRNKKNKSIKKKLQSKGNVLYLMAYRVYELTLRKFVVLFRNFLKANKK